MSTEIIEQLTLTLNNVLAELNELKKQAPKKQVTIKFSDITKTYTNSFVCELFKDSEYEFNYTSKVLDGLFNEHSRSVDMYNIKFVLHELEDKCNPENYAQLVKLAKEWFIAEYPATTAFLDGKFERIPSGKVIEDIYKMTKFTGDIKLLSSLLQKLTTSDNPIVIEFVRRQVLNAIDAKFLNMLK